MLNVTQLAAVALSCTMGYFAGMTEKGEETMKKYELTNETKNVYGVTLHKIRALTDIGCSVKVGDLGGWVQSEDNLSQYGDAWVFGNAMVYGNARVYGNATIANEANVRIVKDIFVIDYIGSRDDCTTFYRAKDNQIYVQCGYKNTDIDMWLKMVEETHGNNEHGQAYKLASEIARLRIKLEVKDYEQKKGSDNRCQ